MRAVWITIAGLTVSTIAIRAAGPVLFGGRRLPVPALMTIALLAPALLAALVITETFAKDGALTLDGRAVGLAVATGAVVLRASLVVTVVAAAGATAGFRALT